jgi:hypothetical protein
MLCMGSRFARQNLNSLDSFHSVQERLPLSSGYREEVLNVELAELLTESGLLSKPEAARRKAGRRQVPDVTIADFWGVRTIIEGRTSDIPDVLGSLEKDAKRRIEEGVAQICVAVVYPKELRTAPSLSALRSRLSSSELQLRVFTEGSAGEWSTGTLDDLTAVLRRSHESLVKEDVMTRAVGILRDSIESASDGILESASSADKVRQIIGIFENRVEEDEE